MDLIDLCNSIYMAIDLIIFNNELRFVMIFDAADFLPKEEIKLFSACYLSNKYSQKILLNVDYLKNRGLFEAINTIYHEAIHIYCDVNGIDDSEGINGFTYHKRTFADVVEAHKGTCSYVDSRIGWNNARLLPAVLYRVKKLALLN